MTRVLVVLGEGGHTRQMLQLLDQLGPAYQYLYVLAAEDELSAQKIRLPGEVQRVGRPRSKVRGHRSVLYSLSPACAICLPLPFISPATGDAACYPLCNSARSSRMVATASPT